jgi:hypothetical protein
MKTILTIHIILLSIFNSFGQNKAELTFIDNFKLSRWRSTESFSDSTLAKGQTFHLIPTNADDTLSSTPIIWIDTIDSITVEYNKFDSNAQVRTDRIVRYGYTFDSKKNLLTIIPKNPAVGPVVFRAKVVRPGKMLELTRVYTKK